MGLQHPNGFMAAEFHNGLISLSELKLEYMKAHRNAKGERMLRRLVISVSKL